MPRRILLVAVLAALVAAAVPQVALAQFYKGKTITMIINYPAGGPADIEGRIVAQHLANHIPGKPTVVIKNVSGAGGIIGSNQLGEAAPNGETIGFFTLDVIAQLVANPSLRTNYSEFVMIAGFENPLVAYARKDTPPGLKVATDIMKASEFKALSLNLQNSNTVNQSLSLDLLGIKYQAVPAYRGLKEVETAILQNLGQFANTSLPGWRGSVEPTMADLVMPLWQIAARGKDGGTPRSRAMPDLPTFEEFFETVHHKKPSGLRGSANQQRPAGGDVQDGAAASQVARRDHQRDAICVRYARTGQGLHPRLFQRGKNRSTGRPRRRRAGDCRGTREGEAGGQGVRDRLHQQAGEITRHPPL
jgi:tripartite-type tricarboxylate transporter receptor subunit TctC